MSESQKEVGKITWIDLTIENAKEIKNFYERVVGWNPQPISMGDYDDYVMNTPESQTGISGICHARGGNSNLPAQWLIYINVADIEKSINECKNLGGKILIEIKNYAGLGKYCIIQDPAGAVCALFEHSSK